MNGYHGNARFILEFHGQFHERATRTRSYAVIAMAHYLPQCALNIAIFHFCDYCDSPTDTAKQTAGTNGFPRRRTPGRRAPTRHAPDNSLDASVALGVTCMIFVFPALGTDHAVYFYY